MDEKNIYAIICIKDSSVANNKNAKSHQITICAVYPDYDWLYHMVDHMMGFINDGYTREGCKVTIKQSENPQGSQKWLHETTVYVDRQDNWINYTYRIYEIKNSPFLVIDDITISDKMKVEEVKQYEHSSQRSTSA